VRNLAARHAQTRGYEGQLRIVFHDLGFYMHHDAISTTAMCCAAGHILPALRCDAIQFFKEEHLRMWNQTLSTSVLQQTYEIMKLMPPMAHCGQTGWLHRLATDEAGTGLQSSTTVTSATRLGVEFISHPGNHLRQPESREQVAIVIDALTQTAAVFARGGNDVVADGVVGSWLFEPLSPDSRGCSWLEQPLGHRRSRR